MALLGFGKAAEAGQKQPMVVPGVRVIRRLREDGAVVLQRPIGLPPLLQCERVCKERVGAVQG
jgi:hypothetical protein